MQAGVDRWLGAELAKEVGGKSVANGDFGTDDPNVSRWPCGGPGNSSYPQTYQELALANLPIGHHWPT
jgi:hypothetical protein